MAGVSPMASLDYLRLASFDFNYSKLIAEFMNGWNEQWKRSKWLQYDGWKLGKLFVGVGEQSHKRHMIMSISGSETHKLAEWMHDQLSFYATRLDVQRTIEKPKHSQLRRIQKSTKTNNCTLIESPENHTLYIGSRTSDCFTRLYEKPLDTMYLRLEFELKGKRARSAWGALVHGKTPSHIFAHYLDKSHLPNTVKAWFSAPDDDLSVEFETERLVQSAQKKLAWIRSLDASINQAMACHEIGVQARAIVHMWSQEADRLDELD